MKKLCIFLSVCLLCAVISGCQAAPTDTLSAASTVTARLADGQTPDGVRRVDVTDAPYTVDILFEADGTVTDLRLLSLEYSGFDHAIYKTKQVFELGKVTPTEPVITSVDFPGDMSAWGFAFTDRDGVECYRTMYLSGEDGSLVVAEGIQ